MGANREKGEVDLSVGGKDYVVRLTWNEIAKFETVRDVAWFEGFAPKLLNMSSISGGEWIALLWASLQRHHPQVSLLDAGDMLTELGIEATAAKLSKCLEFTFPDAKEAAENPQ